MISILIPIYNEDVVDLVTTLKAQADREGIAYEILCYDDGSRAEVRSKNRAALQHLMHVAYLDMSQNLGRAKIRNRLARTARGSRLLFLDGDSQIIKDDFINRYHACDQTVIYGGRTYADQPPSDTCHLHWLYGSRVEAQTTEQRQQLPYRSFLSNNFMISAEVMARFPFDESLTEYGYEDLLFAQRLEAARIPIQHIENPTLHGHLDDNAAFVLKTDHAMANLALLYHDEKLHSPTKLITYYERLKEWEIAKWVGQWIARGQAKRRQRLVEGKGSIRSLQVYKLGRFMKGLSHDR